ncbi:MAG: recombination mediator RecR [Pseudomonadota bacterium]
MAAIGEDIIESLIRSLAKLPGMGRRSARRVVLHLFSDRARNYDPLMELLQRAGQEIQKCRCCGNLDIFEVCRICQDLQRNPRQICVVEQVTDLWVMERTGHFSGVYHVLGGVLSALDGIGPDDLHIPQLIARVRKQANEGGVIEIILATNLTVNGLTTAHYLAEELEEFCCKITRLAHGIPAGGELEFMDDGTLAAALKLRAGI